VLVLYSHNYCHNHCHNYSEGSCRNVLLLPQRLHKKLSPPSISSEISAEIAKLAVARLLWPRKPSSHGVTDLSPG